MELTQTNFVHSYHLTGQLNLRRSVLTAKSQVDVLGAKVKTMTPLKPILFSNAAPQSA